ncbi:hypothetical protein C2G38_2027967 [Gigaspora rosea]|uniref:Uncharacterized protein n=1 Tax=Gigaspora rosea TaxID=44941 RepID=A0A397W549_9GLOM|nr:hypothetical protein C2G38_2027967 [Gigaspora rosea]
MKPFHFIFFTLFMFSFSGTLSNAHPKICPATLLSATSGMDIKGQMGFYQDSNGSLWLTGAYQYGFQDPKEWDYCYTIQNKCGEILFNLTDSLCMEYAKDSGCDGYDDKSKNYSKKRSIFNKRHEDKCEVGPWGTKPWVVKVGDLTWDCGDKDGFKYQNCDGKDIYKDMVEGYDSEKTPKRLANQGPASGFYLVIDGQSKWGKRASIKSPAAINVNNQGGEVAPAAPPAKGPRK